MDAKSIKASQGKEKSIFYFHANKEREEYIMGQDQFQQSREA